MRLCVISLVLLGAASTATAESVTLSGEEAFIVSQKSTCGTVEEGRTRYGIFEGRSYSRVPGERDRHLFNLLGINVRHCSVVVDNARGRGFRSVSREIMVYMDPETGEILESWTNPWTDEEVEVLHVANDPVNMRAYRYERDEEGNAADLERTFRVYGDLSAASAEIPLFYPNPLGGDYQHYVGGMYHAMEIFNSFYSTERLFDFDAQSLGDTHLSWSRVAQWLPWLEMGDRPGMMIFNATGFSTFDRDKIPEQLVEILDDRYPMYWSPPPLDDDRPNETSWTVFRKYMESQTDE